MKVIFITNIPFIRQHRIDMYVDAISESYEVSLWDLSRAYNNKDVVQELESGSVKIQSFTEFETRLTNEKQSGNVVIITGILLYNLKRIYPIIHKLDIPIVNINKEAFATWMGNKGYLKQIASGSFKDFVKAIIFYNSAARKIKKAIKYPNVKYDYLLSSYNFYPEESKHFVKIHHIKYDEFLKTENIPSIIEGEYILFIDAALADHPMYMVSSNRVNRENYIKQLNSYFKLLEERFKMKVIISAHPKSMYSKEDFEGRDIYMYKTPLLVRHATYIVSHYSTSLIDVVLQKKPLKVMYSSALMHSVCRYCTSMGLQMADMIKAEKVNLDKPVAADFVLNENAYNHFQYKYIVNSNEKDKSNKELIIQFLRQLEKRVQ